MLDASPYDEEQSALLAQIEQKVRAFCRTPTWKKVERYLTDRQHDLQTQCGRTGISDSDRAMLQGKIAMILEVRLQLPTAMVQEALQQDTSTGEDAPDDPRRIPVGTPDLT